MDFVLKVGDLVALEEGVMCRVLDNVEYEKEPYDLVVIMPKNIAYLLDPKKLDSAIVKEIVEEGKLFLEQVLDDGLYKKIKEEIVNKNKKGNAPSM
ncbi:MAG: hypothetical protein IKB06_04375 [Clostridia bacterium]|nr:hypothetical protein [Clostridia bacterium]